MEDPSKIHPPEKMEVHSKQPFFKRRSFKEFWADSLPLPDGFSRFLKREKPLRWTDADVERFIAFDPVHGPVLKTAREAAKYAFTGAVVGAVSTAGVSWKYSKSVPGAVLSFLAGGTFGLSCGLEIANRTLQLYRMDIIAAQIKFMEWIEKRTDEPFSESSDIVLN